MLAFLASHSIIFEESWGFWARLWLIGRLGTAPGELHRACFDRIRAFLAQHSVRVVLLASARIDPWTGQIDYHLLSTPGWPRDKPLWVRRFSLFCTAGNDEPTREGLPPAGGERCAPKR